MRYAWILFLFAGHLALHWGPPEAFRLGVFVSISGLFVCLLSARKGLAVVLSAVHFLSFMLFSRQDLESAIHIDKMVLLGSVATILGVLYFIVVNISKKIARSADLLFRAKQSSDDSIALEQRLTQLKLLDDSRALSAEASHEINNALAIAAGWQRRRILAKDEDAHWMLKKVEAALQRVLAHVESNINQG